MSKLLPSSVIPPTARLQTLERERAGSVPAPLSARPSSFPSFALAGSADGDVSIVGPLRDADPAEALAALDADGQAVVVYRLLEGASRCSADRFIQDAAALARLTRDAAHPGLMQVRALGTDRRSFLAEPLDGPTLADVALLGLDLDEKLRVLERICEALVTTHAQAIFFGRLRPASIVLRAPLQPVIAELPASADCVHESGARYAAPEVRRARSGGARGDVYAFGRLMQFVLTETAPVDGDEHLPALDGMRALPAGLVRIARRCLSSDPATRYRNVVSVAADLAQYRRADQVGLRHPAGKEQSEGRASTPPEVAAPSAAARPRRSVPPDAPLAAIAAPVAAARAAAHARRALAPPPRPTDHFRRADAASLMVVLAISLASLTGPDAARRVLGDVVSRTATVTSR